MVVTFFDKQVALATSVTTTIHEMPDELVEEYKYLGTILDSQLKSSSNTEEILRKYHQRQYWILTTFSMTCWFHSTSHHRSTSQNPIFSIPTFNTCWLAHQIIQDPSHALYPACELFPSGCGLRSPVCRTQEKGYLWKRNKVWCIGIAGQSCSTMGFKLDT